MPERDKLDKDIAALDPASFTLVGAVIDIAKVIAGVKRILERDSNPAIEIYLGTAPPEEISDLLSNISILYRNMGGSGINFAPGFETVQSLTESYEH